MDTKLLDALEAHAGRLLTKGHPVEFGRTSDQRDKQSAWLAFRWPLPGMIMVWDSGELEFEAGFAGDAQLDIAEHHEIASVGELDRLVERMISLVAL